ncbi:HpcH/HpaI aldolase/citrate lyase family protein [Acuticoccus mangrovi]|uniref:CoA ester lyase n=1 Tax=Acuticoccus mangrovi TaxID=2796142 RepID=A0A934IGE9_9HYPH|nr:CoA ester lyase [Acuticoccus mangrovi]MBJ3775983.1 CoA ester lyase [Acuticoccus mangrovi]
MTLLRRTVLYVPADNGRALQKARTLAADAVIVDLEDAVAPDRKVAAREAARTALDLGKEVALRINAAGTPWHDDDVAFAREAGFGAVVVPKVRRGRELADLAARLPATLWPMMETAAGILAAAEIAEAAAATGPAALVVGLNDLAAEVGATLGADRAELSHALQQCVLAGRAARLDVIDAVMNDIADTDALVAEAKAGRALGMTGKSVIHPAQIAPVNAVFAPDEAAVAQARAIVAAMAEAEAAGRSVATLDGRLVERLHADAARRILALAEAIAERDAS